MKKPVLFSVKEILHEIFCNEIDNTIFLLKKFNLFQLIQTKLNYVKNKVDRKEELDFNTISISFLQDVNNIVNVIENQEIKDNLKYVIGEISNYLIDSLSENKLISLHDLQELDKSLQNLAEAKGYNQYDLKSRLQLTRIIKLLEKFEKNNNKSTQAPYYEWLGKENKLDEIAKNLKAEKTISSIKSFKSLFTSSPKQVIVNPVKSDFLFVLIDTLHEEEKIKTKIKTGKFIVLVKHTIDLEEKLLFKKAPKYIKQRIKKNKSKYQELKKKANNWIS